MSELTYDKRFSKRILFLIFGIVFTVFLFTSDGHRYTLDEDITHQQALRLATQIPHPLYFDGSTTTMFEYPIIFPNPGGPICLNWMFCSSSYIGHTLTEVPFIFINYHLGFFTTENFILPDSAFDDLGYVYWRNSLDPNTTFLELFYGPLFSAISVSLFFLISRTFHFSLKTTIILTFIFAFSTMIWAYSGTSLNSVANTTFILLGFLFYRYFDNQKSPKYLVYCGCSLGFAFLIRPDAILIIIPMFILLLTEIKNNNKKIITFLSFVIPLFISYLVKIMMGIVNYGFLDSSSSPTSSLSGLAQENPLLAIFGLLLSPGVGLLIFSPILLTTIISFSDFFKQNKKYFILFVSFITIFLIYFGNQQYWHGMNGWGARYLIVLVPFMLLPLGISIDKRKNISFKLILVILCVLGILFNIVYVSQDVATFVWGVTDANNEDGGLYHLGIFGNSPLGINDLTMWTFEYSQLTHSIILFFSDSSSPHEQGVLSFSHFQPDILLLFILGSEIYISTLLIILFLLCFFLYKTFKSINQIEKI